MLGTDLIPFRTWIFESKWISQYPPGWPMVLATGLLLGLPAWVMNALLGGSFTSRITTNIREQKGYTYSPFSQIGTRHHLAFWLQVADDQRHRTVVEVDFR